MASMVRGYPATSDRSRGWLRYLYRKATTPDDWDKDGAPHAHWDNVTGPPTSSWHRMDLMRSYCAIPLMADRTPAWREIWPYPRRAYHPLHRLLGGQGLARSDRRRSAP